MMKKYPNVLLFILLLSFLGCDSHNDDQSTENLRRADYVLTSNESGAFQLSSEGISTAILVSSKDHAGVLKVATDLQRDIEKVTGVKPELIKDSWPKADRVIVIGSVDNSPIIQDLIASGKFDSSDLNNNWEKYIIQKINEPAEGVKEALIVAGSDKRGTIYGMYDISKNIGVSPWYWWADVPVQSKSEIFIKQGRHTDGEPKVKYRGIFINDEQPALGGWVRENFGGFNHQFYEHVFELILRLKGNYLWPAMWGQSIYDEDSLSPKIADEWGIVLGTSHHEPLSRAHVEWSRYGEGPWNYTKNEERLKEFWRIGMERMGTNESLVTLGMRGDGDEAMSESTEVALLEKIVDDQRKIIQEVTGRPIVATPQMWALYKEVQDYYDKGMRAPDDVTLLLCDDNWGNIRKLPIYGDTLRSGGYGIYYHFDYVGGPRNYKWINTTQNIRVWEQMHMAYEFGVDQVWIVNVGDIKPMEFPISFFMDLAWNPTKISADKVSQYSIDWAAEQFGQQNACEIADILDKYTKYNSRVKPELLSSETYSLSNFGEFEKVVNDYNKLSMQAEKVGGMLEERYQSAYFQLVLFPVKASANLNEMYYTVAKNRRNGQQGRANTLELAMRAKELYEIDSLLTLQYHTINGGKWNHQMDQTHIGYTYWQQPEIQVMPSVNDSLLLPQRALFGLSIQGSDLSWTETNTEAILPIFDSFNDQEYYIDLFNKGTESFEFELFDPNGFLDFSNSAGSVEKESRILISVNWDEINEATAKSQFTIKANGESIAVGFEWIKVKSEIKGFVENDGVVSISPDKYSSKIESEEVKWLVLPQLGKTGSAIEASPSTAKSLALGINNPQLHYDVYLLDSGTVSVKVCTLPTLNYHNNEGLSYAVSFDDQAPQIINIHKIGNGKDWNRMVAENVDYTYSKHLLAAGSHTMKLWYIDPRIPFQKFEIIRGTEKKSYLGPYK